MKKHNKYKIKWIGFPKNHHYKLKGVYLIEDFYIGASIHIRERILSHLRLSSKKNYNSINKALYDSINKAYNDKGYLKVFLLSNDPFDELFFIEKSNYNLLNKPKGHTYNVNHSK